MNHDFLIPCLFLLIKLKFKYLCNLDALVIGREERYKC